MYHEKRDMRPLAAGRCTGDKGEAREIPGSPLAGATAPRVAGMCSPAMLAGAGAVRPLEERARWADSYATHHRYTLRTPHEAAALARRLSASCTEPAAVELGLNELILNAIEHGILRIERAEKTALLEEGILSQEIDRRLASPAFAENVVTLDAYGHPGYLRFVITDPGDGFDWRPHFGVGMTAGSAPNGRGITLARRAGFLSLSYNESGTSVCACAHAAHPAGVAAATCRSAATSPQDQEP